MPDVLKYLIVDDEELDRLALENEADKFPFLKKIASCAHPMHAAEMIHQHPPDIIFVDIEMPDLSGLELVKMFRKESMIPIFVTSHPEFAVDSYEMEAFDYLVKPLSSERFARCANRLKDFFKLRDKAFAFDQDQETDCLIIKQGYEKHRLRISDIIYLEAMKDYTRIVTTIKQYLVLAPLGNMKNKLPVEKFVRVHRSFVVQLDKINEVRGNKIYLPNAELPMGKLYKNALNGKF